MIAAREVELANLTQQFGETQVLANHFQDLVIASHAAHASSQPSRPRIRKALRLEERSSAGSFLYSSDAPRLPLIGYDSALRRAGPTRGQRQMSAALGRGEAALVLRGIEYERHQRDRPRSWSLVVHR